MGTLMVCRTVHTNPSFGEVPKDSRWAVDDPVVLDRPKAFKRIEEPDDPLDPDAPVDQVDVEPAAVVDGEGDAPSSE